MSTEGAPDEKKGLEECKPELPSRNYQSVVRFIELNMVGRCVTTPEVSSQVIESPRGRYLSEGRQIVSFTNFCRTRRGFSFDMVRDIRQTLFDIDDAGQKAGNSQCTTRITVIRYQAAEHECAPGIVRGYSNALCSNCGITQNDLQDGTGFLRLLRFEGEDNELIIKEETADFTYLYAGPGKWKPGGVKVHSRYFIEDGVLNHQQDAKSFDVDVDTGRRTPVGTLQPMLYRQTELSLWSN